MTGSTHRDLKELNLASHRYRSGPIRVFGLALLISAQGQSQWGEWVRTHLLSTYLIPVGLLGGSRESLRWHISDPLRRGEFASPKFTAKDISVSEPGSNGLSSKKC